MRSLVLLPLAGLVVISVLVPAGAADPPAPPAPSASASERPPAPSPSPSAFRGDSVPRTAERRLP